MIKLNSDFKDMQKILRNLNAPVYIKRVNRLGKVAFVRKPSCTPEQVEVFFNVYFFMKDNEQNETSTNNQRNVNEQC